MKKDNVKNIYAKILAFTLLLLMIIASSACSSSKPKETATKEAPKQEAVKIRVHSQMPVGNHITSAMDLFIKEAEKGSKGSFKLEHYPSQQLLKSTNATEMTSKGAVEISQLPSLLEAIVPESRFLNTYGVFKSEAEFIKFINGPAHKYLDEACQKKGLKLLGYLYYAPNMVFLTKDKIDSLDKFKGKKIRTTGTASASVVKNLGGAPLEMSSSEMYEALQRGVIDGIWSGYTTVSDRKLYEVGKYLVEGYFGPVPWFIVANLKFWNGLTPDQQKVLLDAAQKAQEYDLTASNNADKEAKEKFIKAGGWVWEIIGKPEGDAFQKVVLESCVPESKKVMGDETFNKFMGYLEEVRKSK